MKRTITGISDADKDLMRRLLPLEARYLPEPETLEALISLGNTITLDKGDALISPGENDPNLYIFIDGLLRCWFWNGDKEETEYFSMVPTVFFNYHSYYGGKGSFYCFDAVINSRVVKICRQDVDELMKKSHDLTLWMLSLANYQLYHHEEKTKRELGDARERYRQFCQNFSDIINDIPLGMIASYLKITPQYLSKIRRSAE